MSNVNVFAPELRGTVKKEVDFIPGAWVLFYDDLTVGSIQLAQQAKESGDVNASLSLMLAQIADWNFSDSEDGKTLPINLETMNKFSSKLLIWISKAQEEILSSMSVTSEKKS